MSSQNNRLSAKTITTGAFWASMTLGLGKIVGFLATLILAAILPASDFGVYALLFLTYNALLLIADLGLRHAIIYYEGDRRQVVNTVFSFLIVADIMLYGALYLGAPYLAAYYQTPELTELLRVIGVGIIFAAYSATCSALLEKELDFKRKLGPDLFPRILQLIVCVSVALAGGGVWSFVAGHLAQSFFEAVGYMIVSPDKPRLQFSVEHAKKLFSYGRSVIVVAISLFAFTNLDDAIIGKVLGASTLGYYYFAYRLSNFPATNINWLAGRIAFPSFSKLKDDVPALRHAFITATRLVGWLIFPASAIIFVFAEPALGLVYGDKWAPAVGPMIILLGFGLMRAVFGNFGSVFFALGRPQRIIPMIFIWMAIGFIPLVEVSERFGLEGAAVLLTAAVAAGGIWRAPGLLRAIDLKLRAYLSVMVAPIILSLLAGGAAAVTLKMFDSTGWPQLILAAAVFSAIYLTGAALLSPDLKPLLARLKK